jgi:heme-degrading monooxygenase HmoA
MNYQVLAGKEQAFEAMFAKVIEVMGKMPGHSHSSLYTEVSSPQNYLIISDWNDRDAFDAFIQSDQFRKVADWGKQQILAGRPKHEYYEK